MDVLEDDTGTYLVGLGQRLKLARQAKQLSQTDIADVLKVSRAAVSQWEAGQVEARLSKLRQAAAYLQISPSWLLTGEGPPFGGGMRAAENTPGAARAAGSARK